MGRGFDGGAHESNSDSRASSGLRSDLWQESGMASSVSPRPGMQISEGQAKNIWQTAVLDFGTAEELYKTTENSRHPFTASEIAASGAVAGVERNEYQAINHGASAAVAGDKNAPALPGELLHPFDSEQQSALTQLGVDMTKYAATENAGIGSATALPRNFGNGSMELSADSLLETPSEIQHDVVQDFSQTGSAGVNQSVGLNDCWFEAPMASVAATSKGQELIASMITQNKDNSYTVRFPGAPNDPINVTQGDIDKFQLQNTAQWANILEAANAKLNPLEVAYGGTDKSDLTAMRLLTGNSTTEYNLTDTDRALVYGRGTKKDLPLPPTVSQSIQADLASGDPVQATADSDKGPLVGHHAYSVLSWNDGAVTLRNPGGSTAQDGKVKPVIGQTIDGVTNLGGGEVQMSASTFMNDVSVVEAGQL